MQQGLEANIETNMMIKTQFNSINKIQLNVFWINDLLTN